MLSLQLYKKETTAHVSEALSGLLKTTKMESFAIELTIVAS